MHRRKMLNDTLFGDSYAALKNKKKEVQSKINQAKVSAAESAGMQRDTLLNSIKVGKVQENFLELCIKSMRSMENKNDFFRFIMPYVNQIEATDRGKEARSLIDLMLYDDNDPLEKDMTNLLYSVMAGIGKVELNRILSERDKSEDQLSNKQKTHLNLDEKKAKQVNNVSALPSIPQKVELNHLNKKGELFDKKHVKEIKIMFAKNPNLTRVKIKRPGAKKGDYDKVTVIKMFNEQGVANYYAIYQGKKHGKEIGGGATGDVKYLVNIETNKWDVLKIPNKSGDKKENARINQEADNLAKNNQLLGRLHRTPYTENGDKEKDYYLLAIKQAPGSNLEKQFLSNTSKPSEYVLHHVIVGMVNELKELHKNGLYHRDIKPEQFHYDPQTEKVTLIDLGSAIDVKKPDIIEVGIQGLSPVYITPEHLALYLKNLDPEARKKADEKYPDKEALRNDPKLKKEYDALVKNIKKELRAVNYHFSEKTDVYALGLSIGQLYGLTKDASPNELFNLPKDKDQYFDSAPILAIVDPTEATQSKVKDPKERDDIITFLKKMTAINPDDRPSMKEVSAFFVALEQKKKPNPDKQVNVILDISAYRKLSNDDKKELLNNLKNADKVLLVETGKPLSQRKRLLVLRQLQKAGVITDSNLHVERKKHKNNLEYDFYFQSDLQEKIRKTDNVRGHLIGLPQATGPKIKIMMENVRAMNANDLATTAIALKDWSTNTYADEKDRWNAFLSVVPDTVKNMFLAMHEADLIIRQQVLLRTKKDNFGADEIADGWKKALQDAGVTMTKRDLDDVMTKLSFLYGKVLDQYTPYGEIGHALPVVSRIKDNLSSVFELDKTFGVTATSEQKQSLQFIAEERKKIKEHFANSADKDKYKKESDMLKPFNQAEQYIMGAIKQPYDDSFMKLKTAVDQAYIKLAGEAPSPDVIKETHFKKAEAPSEWPKAVVFAVPENKLAVETPAKVSDNDLTAAPKMIQEAANMLESPSSMYVEFDVDAALKQLDQQQLQLESEYSLLENTEQKDAEFTDSLLNALQADEEALKAANQDLGNLIVEQFIQEQQELADFKQQATEEFADTTHADALRKTLKIVKEPTSMQAPLGDENSDSQLGEFIEDMPPIPQQAQKTTEDKSTPIADQVVNKTSSHHMNAFIFEKLAAHRKADQTTQDVSRAAKDMADSMHKDIEKTVSAQKSAPAGNAKSAIPASKEEISSKQDELDAVKQHKTTPKIGN